MATVYRITLDPTGRAYYGSSQATISRWGDHVRALKAGVHHCKALQAAFVEHGSDVSTLSFKVLRQDLCLDEARDAELALIRGDAGCYNTPGPQAGSFSSEKKLGLYPQIRELHAAGYSYRRIGAMVGCSATTAFNAIHEARKRL